MPVVAYCALEIKSMTENPNSYSIQSAIEIKTDLEEEVISLPLKYEAEHRAFVASYLYLDRLQNWNK
jgi:hypothetical protein